MNASESKILDDLIFRYPSLAPLRGEISSAADILCNCFASGGKLLICGNGGSASDALHIVGELMKQFVMHRPLSEDFTSKIATISPDAEYLCTNLQGALPAIALVGSAAIESAFANDCAPDLAFAQQVLGLGKEGDVLLGITTSGNSRNVIYAAQVAAAKGMKVIGLAGQGGGKLKAFCNCMIDVPQKETFKVQELHLPVYHALCMMVEAHFYSSQNQ